MRNLFQHVMSLTFSTILLSTLVIGGCATRTYSVYDPYYHDYHHWDHGEEVYYTRWEGDTHREHEDFRKRSDSDKKEYWDWRHKQH